MSISRDILALIEGILTLIEGTVQRNLVLVFLENIIILIKKYFYYVIKSKFTHIFDI